MIALVLIAALAQDARGEERFLPQFKAGDTWVYRSAVDDDEPDRKPLRTEFSVAYPNKSGNWVIAARSADDAANAEGRPIGAIDGHGCIVDVSGQQTLQSPPCVTMVAVGDAWRMSLSGDKFREVKVTGSERIDVPAGTYETLRLEGIDHDRLVVSGSQRADVATSRTTFWYSPLLGMTVRVERVVLRPDGSIARRSEDVLESFAHHESSQVSTVRLAAPPTNLGRRAPRVLALTTCAPKTYPPAAARSGASGTTHLRLAIAANGRVTDAEVVEASGGTREHRILDNAARDALISCTFQPAVSEAGAPMDVTWDLYYTWKLE